jgi:flavodoxin
MCRMERAVIIYDSKGGNTEKVAHAIEYGLKRAGMEVLLRKVEDARDIDYFDFDLVCIGSPSYQWHPIKSVNDFLIQKHEYYRRKGLVKTSSPAIPGKYVLSFCTYSGPHTGTNEATPVCKIMGQFLEHLGFTPVGEWCVLGEFHGSEELSTKGRMGDIRGKPTKTELQKISEDMYELARKL